MQFLQRNRFTLIFVVLLVVCSVLVVRQVVANQTRHLEVREAFILLHAKGHLPQAQRLYERLIKDLEADALASLQQDYQRASTLVDPARPQPDNLVWRYYLSVGNELEKRSESIMVRALKLADEGR